MQDTCFSALVRSHVPRCSPLLPNLAITRARISADDALWVLHGLDGPYAVVLKMVAVDLESAGGIDHGLLSGQTERIHDNSESYNMIIQKAIKS